MLNPEYEGALQELNAKGRIAFTGAADILEENEEE